MILNRFLRNTVTVVRFGPGPKNRQGNPTRVEVSRGVFSAHLEQQSSQELSADRTTTIDVWVVYLPPDADLSAGDQVHEGTRVFEVDGTPNLHMGVREPSHTTARLRYISEVT